MIFGDILAIWLYYPDDLIKVICTNYLLELIKGFELT